MSVLGSSTLLSWRDLFPVVLPSPGLKQTGSSGGRSGLSVTQRLARHKRQYATRKTQESARRGGAEVPGGAQCRVGEDYIPVHQEPKGLLQKSALNAATAS